MSNHGVGDVSARKLLLLLALLVGLGTLGTLGLVAVLWSAVAGLPSGDEWTEDAVPERDLPALFGVRLAEKPLRYRSHFEGFQDGAWQVLVALPPGGAERFLARNALRRGEEEPLLGFELDVLEGLGLDAGVLRVTAVALPPRRGADGGVVGPHRSGRLLEADGVCWLWLSAFET